jgi:hypothetical protein
MSAMKHFELDMLEEAYGTEKIPEVSVDSYFQLQVLDRELNENVLDRLPEHIRSQFDLKTNHKPWKYLSKCDFTKKGLKLELSQLGKKHLERCIELNKIDMSLFGSKLTIGFLWRYRGIGSAIKPYFQRSRQLLLDTKSELFNRLIKEFDAHILICGMNRGEQYDEDSLELLAAMRQAGVVDGEKRSKFSKDRLSIPDDNCTYLKGLGYAAEMEIMAQCDLLLMMPSGFSEPLWMRRDVPTVLVDPPPDYMLKLLWNRMPFFNNFQFGYAKYNLLITHTADNVLCFLNKQGLLNVRKR